MSEAGRIIQIPCQKLSQLIGQALEQGADSTAASLTKLYEQECGGKKPSRAELEVPIGAHVVVGFAGNAAFITLVNDRGNPVTVLVNGGDGGLIIMDANGVITRVPPEGPGDPEVRQALASITQAMNVLNGLPAAGTAAS